MCAIDYATVKRSEAQFRSRQMNSATPSSHSAPSRSTPSAFAPSFSGDVSLGDVMAQLQRMDARLDTLSTELYQVNARVGRIAWRQATIGGFAPNPTPSPPHPVAFDSNADDDGDDDDASDDDGDANSTDEMSTWHSTFCHSWQKGGVVLAMKVVTLRGRVSFWDHFVRGSVVITFFLGM